MDLVHVDPKPMSEPDDDSTINTTYTPPETIYPTQETIDLQLSPLLSSSVPWPGSTYIIRCLSTGEVLTLRNGEVTLARPGGRGSIHWACVESQGWLGFRNTTSGKMLGHNIHGNVGCWAHRHFGWEHFCVRARPEGGYVLLMTHWDRLWWVGGWEERGVMRLAKFAESERALGWVFVKV